MRLFTSFKRQLLFTLMTVAIMAGILPAQAVTPAASTVGELGASASAEAAQSSKARPKGPAKRVPVGISTGSGILYEDRATIRRYMQTMRDLGTKRIRIDVSWDTVEYNQGRYDWARHDVLIGEARRARIQVMAIVGYEPDWAKRYDSAGRKLPPNAQLFGNFVRAAARKYKGSVRAWEIWNEPNLVGFWGAQPNGLDYGRVAKVALRILRKEAPKGTLVVGGMAPGSDVEGQAHPVTFLKDIYRTVPRYLFDAVSVHPYTYPYSPRLNEEWSTMYRLQAMHEVMKSNGDGRKLIWLTEYGAPVGPAEGAVSESRQAVLMREGIQEARSRAYTGPIYLYSLRDAGSDENDRENRFGLVRQDWSKRPAYFAVRKMLR